MTIAMSDEGMNERRYTFLAFGTNGRERGTWAGIYVMADWWMEGGRVVMRRRR